MATTAATGFRRKCKVLFSAEDLLHLPAMGHILIFQAVSPGRRLELVKGKIYEIAAAGARHRGVANTVGMLFGAHVRNHRLGVVFAAETGFILARNPDTVRAPDAAFVSAARLPAEGLPDGFLELAPDLVVEVVSPNDRPGEVREKISEWLEAGTRVVVVLYPRTKTATVHRHSQEPVTLAEQDTLTGDDVVPGSSVRVGELFG